MKFISLAIVDKFDELGRVLKEGATVKPSSLNP